MTMLVGNQIEAARILTLRADLKLEIKGLHRHGRSCYTIVKEMFGFKGNKERVLEQLNNYIEANILPKENGRA